ncbi:ExeM/NucH family extracellular endonuclease [Idiomarina sp. HP20-50]|uniref:ExeM/NucH family extracellular endonuclease n=1 Tax=Idiomarina sp. HP20-50 TaxID=3070813 RepID=UPI00294ABA37|nr:ExeM/NucH family extracellular endonuclease [Idiomarina sp. HP20-50]MDV6314878.1 ExeM/NucH family extracellular endonuclease [Idiomarina sp. HP20-50]
MNKKILNLLPALFLSGTAVADTCGNDKDIIPIPSIQGEAQLSEKAGDEVTVRGVVTASWQEPDQLGGFFIHSFAEDIDDNPATSEGLFVATKKQHSLVTAGEQVIITGQVAERSQLTSLVKVSNIVTCGTSDNIPDSVELRLPVQSLSQLEALEGMPVKLSAEKGENLTIAGHYNYPRYGYFDISSGRLWTPTQVVMPGKDANRQAKDNQLNRLQVDDNSDIVEPTPLPFAQLQHGSQTSLRSGSTVASFHGVLSQFHDGYRIQPTDELQLKTASKQPELSEKASDSIRIASFNVLNFFNGNGAGAGFPTPRGADDPEQMRRQLKKIVAALTAINADVVGLMELENDGFGQHSAIMQLVNALEKASGKDYAIAEPRAEKIGTDQITVGIIYQPERVTPSSHALFTRQGPFSWGSRPPLAQSFIADHNGKEFSVIVNHFKSKGSCPEDAESLNSNQNDGQACWNDLRLKSSQQLVQWIQSEALTNSILLGDFNAYYQEDPIRYLSENGFYNPSDATDYSYVYDSQAGALDHVFVENSLKGSVKTVYHLPFNADEPWVYDYRNETYFSEGPFRSSDHDPLVLDLEFSESGM